MAIQNVVDNLVDVQFYTSLDPYYYVVDNRPLRDLDENIRLVAEASDNYTGSADRAVLAAATNAYATLGYGDLVNGDPIRQAQGMFSGSYDFSGLNLHVTHGYFVYPQDKGGIPSYIEPRLAIHDAVTPLVLQSGRGGTVQVSYRDSTDEDRVPSSSSAIQVATVSFKQGSGPGVFPLPDAGNIVLMHVDVPSGASTLLDSYITLVNMKTIRQTSNAVANSKVSYVDYVVSVSIGSQNINLSSSNIDTTDTGSIEVFVQGVNQFNWSYNATTDNITLEAPLTETAEVRVRQTVINLM